jgi:hypothetical protein
LVNNILDDEGVAKILESAFIGRHQVRKISLAKNEFGLATAKVLERMYLNEDKTYELHPKYWLEELRIF